MKKYIGLILISALFLSACGKKTTTNIAPSPTPKLVELAPEDRPTISLTPRSDGHELSLKLASISNKISKIEYELTYLAVDGNLEIEKGASGIIESKDFSSQKAERKILLGTESCTSGCKYKYDTGITGGSINLIFTTTNGQISTFDSPFILKTVAEVKKAGKLVWTEEDFTYTPTKYTGISYFIAHKDFKNGGYMVTNSGAF
ncbi:MAG: hypothetical protein US68_C0009G0037 [Candidatus Shapirobacteria bacterium GW2011_GWE1_38_10]|uniref:Lipoprotein n=1 Tax=Candidatus Shapirobacteria bacterium GW2011_GWE1_38_10 TaxID=1618488 RepID=A0A0G0I6C5_9BACT|nr:MAG: hypothetical protein US46_C0002G0055 [Candidatus Shapirobacteria bacterium GW2011_GWF2_37_20]KKQ50082.1 MAG: hypothetical protein US68_C0009G0037 [Candidatus Shapirobacteria bacterium GW2011_GWE1_38_10]KKQ65269.1 MAG: hypothetical protein US85_C0001G0196 [Candidatus Shapirobacteria bacterium GW2011_GWF1_38_23]HBP51153.1 hypothetical protein [Candidatus Shapirobacteria bacterium]